MNDINSKTHTDYPITNNQWKLMENGVTLWHYLDTLQLVAPTNKTAKFAGIRDFYLRERHNSLNFELDPWNRKFVVMPPEKPRDASIYRYYSYSSLNLNLNVDIIITTVNKCRVYCVDVTQIL